jgi:hypothetical protein
MLLEAAIGTQKFFFRPAVLGRGNKAPLPKARTRAAKGGAKKSGAGMAGKAKANARGSRRRPAGTTKAKRPPARARTAGKR